MGVALVGVPAFGRQALEPPRDPRADVGEVGPSASATAPSTSEEASLRPRSTSERY